MVLRVNCQQAPQSQAFLAGGSVVVVAVEVVAVAVAAEVPVAWCWWRRRA